MAHGSNSFDSKQLQGYLTEIDTADDEIDRLREDYKGEAKPFREHIKEILNAAKNDGINMAAFRAVLVEHRSGRRQQKRIDALDHDDRLDYDAMVIALGPLVDTPLGAAALTEIVRNLKEKGATMTVTTPTSTLTAIAESWDDSNPPEPSGDEAVDAAH